jgi:6,7-dimethyl-8-ribityllumazine synthase
MPNRVQGGLVVGNKRFAVVAARFNEFVTSKLLGGALDTLARHGCPENQITEVFVPGAFEIPLAALKLAQSSQYDAVICLGCVIRGETPHFDYICAEVAKGVARVGYETGVPTIFGVITADTLEQCVHRAGAKSGNKGAEAALAAIEMTNLLDAIDAIDARPSPTSK